MTLEEASQRYREPETTVTLYRVKGHVLTRPQVVAWALAKTRAGKHYEAADILNEAGIGHHALLEEA